MYRVKPVSFSRLFKVTCYLLLGLCFIGIFQEKVQAQKYEIVTEDEYEEYYKKPVFVPDIRFSGNFRVLYDIDFEGLFSESTSDNTRHDLKLNFRTEVNENVSVNGTLTNEPYFWGNSRDTYYTYDNLERTQGEDNFDRDLNVIFEQLYLEYNSNPNSILRFGRQEIALGDKLGLIYSGIVDAFSYSCRIGTWCLEFGIAKIGENNNEAYWIQFFYPVYESVEFYENFWTENQKRRSSYLDFSFYRIEDNQRRLPLAQYGGRTFQPFIGNTSERIFSPFHLQYEGEYVYFDRGFTTFGFNLDWFEESFGLKLNYIQQSGSKDYYYRENSDGNREKIATSEDQGILSRLALLYQISNHSELGFEILYSSADPVESTSDELPWNRNNSFYEWNKGTYGDAYIYFNGVNETGQAHSINNLISYAFSYRFHSYTYDLGVNMKLFYFQKSEEIFNEDLKKVKDIGLEFDFRFYTYFAEKLKLDLDLAAFLAGGAYSPNDNIIPTSDPENVSKFTATLSYSF